MRFAFEKARPAAGAHRGDRFRRRLVDREDVAARDAPRRDAIGFGALDDVDLGHPVPDVRVDRVVVVLADEEDRQLLQRREVRGLVENALVHGALAEENADDRVRFALFQREGVAERQRQGRADDGRGSDHAGAEIS